MCVGHFVVNSNANDAHYVKNAWAISLLQFIICSFVLSFVLWYLFFEQKRCVCIQPIVDAGLAFVHDLNDNGDCITDADGGNGNFFNI